MCPIISLALFFTTGPYVRNTTEDPSPSPQSRILERINSGCRSFEVGQIDGVYTPGIPSGVHTMLLFN
jgi:hypothetical protein